MKPRFRVSICKGVDCRSNGADAVLAAAKDELARNDPQGMCRLERGGCYGLCREGPNVVIRPDNGRAPDPFARENYRLMGTPGEVHHPGMTPERVVEVLREKVRSAPAETEPVLAVAASGRK